MIAGSPLRLYVRSLIAGLMLALSLAGVRSAAAQDPAAASDPVIVAQATFLQNDPNQIFAFVRDQIRFDVYAGSVRGARGTLWSRAGNTLDKASLLVALLGAAGQTAQYQHGTLTNPAVHPSDVRPSSQLIGCIPTDVPMDDPGNQRDLQAGVTGLLLGHLQQRRASRPQRTSSRSPGSRSWLREPDFTTVPQNLRQKVTVRLKVETYNLGERNLRNGPARARCSPSVRHVRAGRPRSLGRQLRPDLRPAARCTSARPPSPTRRIC